MSTSIKPGVRIHGMSAQIFYGLGIVKDVLAEIGVNFVLTAGIDGGHTAGSSHYAGNAGDVRSHEIPADKIDWVVSESQKRLGPDFFIQKEADHLHVQFKPQATYTG